MDATLSALYGREVDMICQVSSTDEGRHQCDMNVSNAAFAFEDAETIALCMASHGEFSEAPQLHTGLPNSNLTDQPTTVAPLETLILNDNISESTAGESTSTDSASESQKSTISPYTAPTPGCDSFSPEPAMNAPQESAPANQEEPPQELRVPTTPVMIEIITRHIHDEWVRLNEFQSAAFPRLTQSLMDHRPVESPYEFTTHRPLYFNGHTQTPFPMGFGQFCPYPLFSTPMWPTTYPVQQPLPPPVSNTRTYQFVEPEVPLNFVVNPHNHGRWQYDRQGNRHYLNAPKKPRTH